MSPGGLECRAECGPAQGWELWMSCGPCWPSWVPCAGLGSAPSCRVGGLFGLAQPVLWVKAPSFPPEVLAESEVPRQIRAGYCSLILCPKSPWLPPWSLALGREVPSPPELLPQSLRFQPPCPPPIQAATCTPSVTDGLEHSLLLGLACAFLSRTLSHS